MVTPPTIRSGFTPSARRLAILSAAAIVFLEIAYVIVLAIGLATLPSPTEPISDPWFTMMELLILAMVPVFVTLMVGVHAYAGENDKAMALSALIFMAMMAVLTAMVHFSVLTLSRTEAFAGYDQVLAFRWPSVVYALDILAWDIFFALSVLCAAPVFRGPGLSRAVRWALVLSGVLALAGLIGVPTGDMRLRNIGIVGYALVMTVAAGLMWVLFRRTPARAGT